MPREGETTDLLLLERVGDWADHGSWLQFIGRYDPLIRKYCHAYRFDADAAEELCQRIWIELARRLRNYQYDPSHRFRAWLKRLCQSRAVDLWRQRQVDWKRSLNAPGVALFAVSSAEDADEEPAFDRFAMMLEAERVQAMVRRRVDERTWCIFWQIVIEGRSVRETAEGSGLSYAAAFAAQKRVRRMLREEASRLAVGRLAESER